MLSVLAFFALQAQEPSPIVLPPGSSHEFQGTVYAVQAAVAEGDWAEAQRLAARLPSTEVTVTWDDKGLSAEQKVYLAAARDQAVQLWQQGIPGLEIKLVPNGKVKLGFVPSLPPNADSPGPAGAVFLYSPDEGDPVVEGVLSLLRGDLKKPVEPLDVRNEVVYAIGAYLGLARQPRTGSLMFRSEEPYVAANAYTMSDGRLVKKTIELADRVREEVGAKRDPGIAAPQIVIDPVKFTPRPVSQAQEMALTLQVTNQGKGTLDYRLVPDCGCFVLGVYKEQLAPGETTVVQILINTYDFTGKLQKALFVYSNDPFFPIKRIPLETVVRPAYRFVDQIAEPTLIVDRSGAKFETILVLDEGQDFKITKAAVNGVSARVSVDEKPWEGVLDYPEIGEGPKKRRGYRISALVAPGVPPGRLNMQIELDTDDEVFKKIYHSVYVQKGIVAVPLSIYFGSITQAAARGSVVLTRPGRPYKVLKVESDNEFVKASVEPYRPDTEYKIVATYTGGAPIGRLSARIKVHTDDPEQPIVEIGVEGTVK
jgi:hypothetical protein